MKLVVTGSPLAALALVLVLGGCATDDDTRAGPTDTHTMPDGTVMEGSTHVHDDSHDHGESQAGESQAHVGPSEAARMVCAGQVVEDVARIMGVDEAPEPASAWQKPDFTCTFDLENGPLVLSVHDATDEADGTAHFRSMQASRKDAVRIKGVYSLGLPAYETPDGTVAFVRDGKTLEVDATKLTGKLGTNQDLDRTEVAYAVATSVLACWTEHA